MGKPRILDWQALSESKKLGNDIEEIANNPKTHRIIQNAIMFYLARPHPTMKNAAGKIPKVIQNFLESEKEKAKGALSLQNFIRAKRNLFDLQNITTSTAFQEVWSNLTSKFIEEETFDMGWNMIFDEQPLNGLEFFEIMTVTGDIEFKIIPEGDSIQYYGHADSGELIRTKMYGAGYAYMRQWLLTRKWALLEDGIRKLRDAAFRKMAQYHYALIEAVSAGQNVNWQATTVDSGNPLYTATRDSNTFDFAALKIINDCKDKGYGELQNQTFVLLHDFNFTKRIKEAFALTLENFAGSPNKTFYNFMPISTTMLADPTKVYVILPKNKIQTANLLQLSAYNQFNQNNFRYDIANWMGFGGAIADEEQVVRCNMA
jgi:hypothetical protein